MKRVLFIGLFLSLTAGCIIIPSSNKASIQKIQDKLTVGSTTKREIILILGEPDIYGDGYIYYRKRKWSHSIVWYLYYAGGYHATYMDMYFEFDSFDILSDCRLDGYNNSLNTIETKEPCGIPEGKE